MTVQVPFRALARPPLDSTSRVQPLLGGTAPDLMLAVEGHPVQTVSELLAQVAALKPGTQANLRVLRKSDELVLTVTPAQRPKAKTAPR